MSELKLSRKFKVLLITSMLLILTFIVLCSAYAKPSIAEIKYSSDGEFARFYCSVWRDLEELDNTVNYLEDKGYEQYAVLGDDGAYFVFRNPDFSENSNYMDFTSDLDDDYSSGEDPLISVEVAIAAAVVIAAIIGLTAFWVIRRH